MRIEYIDRNGEALLRFYSKVKEDIKDIIH